MTAIVGIAQDGVVYMGGDSAVTNGWLQQATLADPKVFKVQTAQEIIDGKVVQSDLLIGISGSVRAGQLLRYKLALKPLSDADRADLAGYMVTTFLEAARKAMKDNGYGYTNDGRDWYPGEFMVGIEGELFVVGCDYSVIRTVERYAAVGCGDDLALGVLRTTQGFPPEDRILKALQAASEASAGVKPPFVVEKLGQVAKEKAKVGKE